MSNKLIILVLTILCILSLFLHIYKIVEPSLNEDEASHGYNTYSVLTTGRDEYGHFPTRFLAFGENKLPIAGLMSSPFVQLFGLNKFSLRAPSYIVGTIFPILFYLATFYLTRNKKTSLIAALVSTGNIWLHTISRHLHEAVLMQFFLLLIIIVTFRKKSVSWLSASILGILSILSLFTYHSAKVLIPGIAIFVIIRQFISKEARIQYRLRSTLPVILTFTIIGSVFLSTEFLKPNNRVGNLSYFTNPVFTHEIEEGRRIEGSALFYNKVVYGSYRFVERSLRYLSPDFLTINSDPNMRFGASYLPLLTIYEYLFFFIGIITTFFVIIRKKNTQISLTTNIHISSFILLVSLIILSIIPASVSLPVNSATRSYSLLVPLIIFVAMGVTYTSDLIRIKFKFNYSIFISIIIFSLYIFSISSSWNIYFTKYLSDPNVQRSWQSGMEDVAKYVWKNYDKYDKIYITRELGQPYIFLLFFGGPYPPVEYQKIAKTMPYNEYGFWEQDNFDKFVFTTDFPESTPPNSLIISETDKSTYQSKVKERIGKYFYAFFER